MPDVYLKLWTNTPDGVARVLAVLKEGGCSAQVVEDSHMRNELDDLAESLRTQIGTLKILRSRVVELANKAPASPEGGAS